MPETPPRERFIVRSEGSGSRPAFAVTLGGETRAYRLSGADQNSYLDFFAAVAADFGTRAPLSRRPFQAPAADAGLRPLLTEPLSPAMPYGYGDPCVLRAPGPDGRPAWWLTATSNDAPDAFPILRSDDLERWTMQGFVFPEGQAPRWALTGAGRADFWAPEMHRVGDEYWVCFTARTRDRELAIGLARGPSPEGPFRADREPLLRGGVIDAHLLVEPGAAPLLFWKEDTNGVWPRRLAALLGDHDALVEELFVEPADRRTAALSAALWRRARTAEPMEQFFLLQPLIEAAAEDLPAFEERLRHLAAREPSLAAEVYAVLSALKTKVYGQPLTPDGSALAGQRAQIIENDQTWEAHLIEGVWVAPHEGRYYLFYSGNDFSTQHYGIGAAVADRPLGPYRKTAPLLRSSREWAGPGHPSVAPGPDGQPWIFLHAFHPGRMGYGAFRALLAGRLRFGPEGPSIG